MMTCPQCEMGRSSAKPEHLLEVLEHYLLFSYILAPILQERGAQTLSFQHLRPNIHHRTKNLLVKQI